MRVGRFAALTALAQIGPAATWLPPVRRRLAPALCGYGPPDHLALTFDDGPDPVGTPAVLAELEALGWHATFFMLGEQARAHPAVAAAVADAGHEVALHGDAHRYLLGRSPLATHRDLAGGLAAVHAATGVRPRSYRPPYGVLTTAALVAARRLGLRPVLWSAWGRDWEPDATPESVLGTLGRGTLAGGTVLLHDSDITSAPRSWETTARTLPLLAHEVARHGWRVGTVAEHRALAAAR